MTASRVPCLEQGRGRGHSDGFEITICGVECVPVEVSIGSGVARLSIARNGGVHVRPARAGCASDVGLIDEDVERRSNHRCFAVHVLAHSPARDQLDHSFEVAADTFHKCRGSESVTLIVVTIDAVGWRFDRDCCAPSNHGVDDDAGCLLSAIAFAPRPAVRSDGARPVFGDAQHNHAAQAVERLRAGRHWQAHNFVFATEFGAAIDPRNILRAVSRSAARVGIEHPVGVHSLRHSAATAMLEAGVNLKAVSDLLGHADIRMTTNSYGHVSDADARSAMESIGRAVDGTS